MQTTVKRVIATIFLIVVTPAWGYLSFVVQAASTSNLINNPSFENEMDGWGVFYAEGDPKATIDDTVARSGNASIRLETYGENDRIIIPMRPHIPVNPGQSYMLEGWVKTELAEGGGSAHFRVQFKGSDRKNIAQGHLQYSHRVRGQQDWTFVQHFFSIPEDATFLAIELALEKNMGTVWWDDIALYDRAHAPQHVPDGSWLDNGFFKDGLEGWKIHQFSGEGDVWVDDVGLHIETASSDDRLAVHQSLNGLPFEIPFLFETYVKTEKMGSEDRGAYVRLQFRDSEGGYTRSHLTSPYFNDADVWTPITLSFFVPEGTTRVQIELFSEYAVGRTSFKDTRLVALDDVFEVTSADAEVTPGGAVLLRWDVSVDGLGDEPAMQYKVYRLDIPDVPTEETMPLAIVSERSFTDRSVRSHQDYYYKIVPELPGAAESKSSDAVAIRTGELRKGMGPSTAEAIVQNGGIRLSWTFPAESRIGYLDIYRYEGPGPVDFDAVVSESEFVYRARFYETTWLDASVSMDDTDRLGRTWYLIRSIDPDSEEVEKRIVAVTGMIPRIPILHGGEHPFLVVTKDQLEKVRTLAESDEVADQLLDLEIIHPANSAAVIWESPQSLPEKDDNSGHATLARTARNLGLAYQLNPERNDFAQAAKNILVAYADQYVSYPKLAQYGGRVTYQSLNESSWLVQIAWAYDLIHDTLTEDERTHIEHNLLREAVAIVQSYPRGRLNWQIWHNAGIGAAAFVMKDEALIAEVLETGNEAARKLFDEGLFADGLWWEQSIGYHNYTLTAWVWLALITGNNGYDLFGLQVGDRTFQSMFDSILHHAFSDASHPAIGDTSPNIGITNTAWIFGPALMRYDDPRYAWVLQEGGMGSSTFPAILVLEKFRETEVQPIVIGSTDFAPQGRNDYGSTLFEHTGMALFRGSVRQSDHLGASFIYKPGGTFMGHQHADNLNLNLTALGHQWLAGSGRFPYSPGVQDQRHGTYARHTAAKNSLVVGGVSQIPQRNNTGMFTTDGAKKSRGYLDIYVPGPTVQLARGGSDEVYPGVHLERTVLVTDGYVLDVYDAVGEKEHRFDWIIHVTGSLHEAYELGGSSGETAVVWSEVDGTLGSEDGMQFLTVEQKLQTINAPSRLRWVAPKVGGVDRYLDQWMVPDHRETSVYVGTSLWTINPGHRQFVAAQTEAESTRFVSMFAPTMDESFIHRVIWLDDKQTMLGVQHAKGRDIVILPPVEKRGGAVHYMRVGKDGQPTDFLMAADQQADLNCLRVHSSEVTSLSMGMVDGVWILHHEGAGDHQSGQLVSLSIEGLRQLSVSLLNHQGDTAKAVDRWFDEEVIKLDVHARETYVFAPPDMAREIDLTTTLGAELEYLEPHGNQMINGTFDRGLESWGVHHFTSDPEATVTAEEGMLTITSLTGDERVSVNQTIANVDGEQSYVLEYKIKTEGVLGTPTDRSTVRIRLQSRDMFRISILPHIYTQGLTKTDGWETVRFPFVLPKGADSLQVEILSEYVIGTVHLKDVFVERLAE